MHEFGYLIGVDGGGSDTRARVQRATGELVGTGEAGPSALGQGVTQAWRNIELAARRAFESAGSAVPAWRHCALAAGLSGVGHAPWRDAFIAGNPGFGHLEVDSDSYTMLMGAH